MRFVDQINNPVLKRQMKHFVEAREVMEKIRIAEKNTMEADIGNLRKDIAKLCHKVEHKKMPPKSVRLADDCLYDRETHRFFTAKLDNLDGLDFCVEPNVADGHTVVLNLYTTAIDALCRLKQTKCIIYSINGFVIYKRSVDESMEILDEAKKQEKPVVLGLLHTWESYDELRMRTIAFSLGGVIVIILLIILSGNLWFNRRR